MGWIIGKGIGVPFRMGSSQNWSSYWSSLISATVENAAPTNVVLTFPSPRTSLGASDFTIAGFTISSASWTGAALTLVLSTAVVYGDSLTVTFVTTGGTHAVTNNVAATAELTTYITGLTTPLSLAQRRSINEFIKALKTGLSITNLSDVFDVIYVLAGETVESSLRNLVSNAYHCTLQGDPNPSFVQYKYFKGDGVNGYINCNYKPKSNGSAYQLNSASVGLYQYIHLVSNTVGIGVRKGASDDRIYITACNSLGKTVYFVNTDATVSSADNLSGRGLFVASRTANNLTTIYMDAVSLGTDTDASSDRPDYNLYLLALNSADSPLALSEVPISFAFVGKGFNITECGIIKSALINYFNDLPSFYAWEKQGAVVEGNGTHEGDNVFEPFVIYEGNPQILSGVNVFKMWYSAKADGDLSINYAESLDGVSWAKYESNPIIADHCRHSVVNSGGVYYLYAAIEGDTQIDLFTSADGVNFTLHTSSVIARGIAGTWDATNIANSFVWIEEGTWYMIYDGLLTTDAKWSSGLATSSDGITWTKYASNPVLTGTGTLGGTCVRKVNGSYYAWVISSATGTLPTDIDRYKSSDLYTWVKDTLHLAFYRTTADEGVDTAVGQVADPFILEYNNKCYLFHQASADGSGVPDDQRIKLAIADMTLEELVLTQEGIKLSV